MARITITIALAIAHGEEANPCMHTPIHARARTIMPELLLTTTNSSTSTTIAATNGDYYCHGEHELLSSSHSGRIPIYDRGVKSKKRRRKRRKRKGRKRRKRRRRTRSLIFF